jgi:seryl-tRNA synthetase
VIDINLIRQDPTAVAAALGSRGTPVDLTELLGADERLRANKMSRQTLQSRRNALSGQIGEAMRAMDHETAQRLKDQVQEVNAAIPLLDTAIDLDTKIVQDMLLALPNIPAPDVPVGRDEDDNLFVSHGHDVPNESVRGRPHEEIGNALGMMDFESAAAMSGSRFVVLFGQLARLERAIGQFMLDYHITNHGYREVSPPLLVKDTALVGTGQLPKFADDLYATGGQYLIPTAEVPLTNLVADRIFDADLIRTAFPLRLTALTPCFRSEAGAAGKDTRGMLRQHQFMKCELVAITTPEEADAEHERMLVAASSILEKLGLPFRVMKLCTGDLGFSARRTYDIEVWMPSQGVYREISSVSWCGDFQARRMKARYRAADGKTAFVHTLNGSGLAVGRTLIAIMENYATDNGIRVPAVLQPYMGEIREITA